MSTEFEGRYPLDVEREMRNFHESLSEKDRRRYAAVEAAKFGYGGVTYIAEVLGCSEHSIERGRDELQELPHDPAEGRIRRPGGVANHSPQRSRNWMRILTSCCRFVRRAIRCSRTCSGRTCSPRALSAELEALGTPASPGVVRDLLHERGLGRRQIEKTLAGGSVPQRNAQFEHIFELEVRFPILCMDTKKKERLGRLYRDGRIWTTSPQQAFDHDFPSWSEGVIIPHGIYDLQFNHEHINIGLSHDASQFACDSLAWFWEHWGLAHYPAATEILLECDAGGSNNCRNHIFRVDLQNAVNRIRLPIRMAHNMTRACAGVLFDSLHTVVDLMKKTSTRTGLTTTVHVIRKACEVGRKLTGDALDALHLNPSAILPQWNYLIAPR